MVSTHREKYKAKFKKGQKCLLAKFFVPDDSTEELLLFIQGEIMRAEKRTVEVDVDGSGNMTQVSSYHYQVTYTDDDKLHDEWREESELYKYHVDLLTGEESLIAEQIRQQAWQQHDYKKAQARLEKIPERLRLRIPVALKKCVLEDYERVYVEGNIESVRPRLRVATKGGAGVEPPEKVVDTMDIDREGDTANHDKLPTTSTPAHSGDVDGDAYKDMSVRAIIEMWRTQALNEDDVIQDDSLAEGINIIAESLLTYFNHSLYQFLLYPAEVPLYDEVLRNKRKRDGQEVQPVDVYGVQHLVRLLVKLPELVCVQMMVLPVESARYIVTVEDRLMELMELVEKLFFSGGKERSGDDEHGSREHESKDAARSDVEANTEKEEGRLE